MDGRANPSSEPDARVPRWRSGRLLACLLSLMALALGCASAIATAGSAPSDSGGGGLITTSTDGSALTVGTTTLVATGPSTDTTDTTGVTDTATTTTTTPSSSCTEPVVGTVTTTVNAAPTTAITSPTSTSCVVAAPTTIPAPAGSPFGNRGMWIWELPATDGGDLSKVIAQAKAYGIGTVYVKSGDGNAMWSQFNPTLVDELHAAGLHVCAWQYVYGYHPVAEANVGLEAVRDGAECLVIDAETQYQRKYAQAQQYMGTLRGKLGSNYPIALAGFPYVDYHPTFPYSVFLGKNGAQYNLPQMYWQDIGTTVDKVYAHTFAFNELYQRPIFPLGQLYDRPSVSAVKRFRSVGLAYKATGVSWWDWQSAGNSQFSAIAAPAGPIKGYVPNTTVAAVAKGAVGDLVVLAQEHLWNTRERVTIDGGFGANTQKAIRAFQANNGLPVSGVITPQTWNDLLKVPLPNVKWQIKGKSVRAQVTP
jgi:hypothetical protein